MYLVVEKTKKVWRLRYKLKSWKTHKPFTIGEYPYISLSEARKKALELKALVQQGIDLQEWKKQKELEELRLQNRKRVTDLIEEYLKIKKQNVSESRFKKNYVGTFNNYVIPFIGKKFIDEITKQDILTIIKEVPKIKLKNATRSSNKTYKAKEVLNILKDLFEFGIDSDYLDYNPAYNVKIDRILPQHKEQHISALLDIDELRKLYKKISNIESSITAKILQFQALTLLRNGNIRNLKWEYINWDKKLIIYPKESMKASHSDFRLPLTETLVKFLEYFKPISGDKAFVFISSKTNKPISENFLSDKYKQLGYKGIHSPHGWRSSFRTIAAECLEEHKCGIEAIESQLHHKIGDKVVQAYLRTDFLEQRRKLLEWWEKKLLGKI
ncbi:tyrosine-type recombinase/integrase [Caminibacter sp.]